MADPVLMGISERIQILRHMVGDRMHTKDEYRVGDTIMCVCGDRYWLGRVVEQDRAHLILGPPDEPMRAHGQAAIFEWKLTKAHISAWRKV